LLKAHLCQILKELCNGFALGIEQTVGGLYE